MNSHVKTIDNGTIWHVDVEELEVRVDALSKGLATAHESIYELKDDCR